MSDETRAAIFDLDGTLADTAPDLIGAAHALLSEKGLAPLDPAVARRTAGRGGKALIALGHERAGAPLDGPAVDALFPHYLALYEARIDQESRLFPGVEPALQRLATAGWRLGVCTNKPEAPAQVLMERLGVRPLFASLIGADTLPQRKPDPAPYIAAVERAGGAVGQSVLIGDTVTDRDTPRPVGVPGILVTFGPNGDGVAKLAPDALLHGYGDLLDVVKDVIG